MMDSHSARYAALMRAREAATMWELPWPEYEVQGGEQTEVFAKRSVEEMQPILIELLRRGHVQLYQLGDSGRAMLDLDAALEAASNIANWNPDEPESVAYILTTTESGERELDAVNDASEAS
jgi:hypothetical protein